MSISNTTSQVSYTGNGATLDFATTFRFLDEEHLVVEVDDVAKVLDVDYTVAGEDEDEGGTVSFIAAPAAASAIVITRATPLTQETSFRNNGQSTFSPVLHERALDKLTMIAQEADRRLDALELLSDLVTVDELADAARYAGTFTTDADRVEDTFPFDITVPGGESATFAIFRVFPNGDDAHRFDTPPLVQWTPTALNTITIVAINGLDPDTLYVLAGLVIF